jgi:ATP-dependent exoDNAse (exonuclease V) alpha subunit
MLKYNPKYQLKHLSVRVPWHDNGWNGTICNNPKANGACLILKNCSLNRDDAAEDALKGKSIADLSSEDEYPTCVGERGFFMAKFPLIKHANHPYVKSSKSTHGHLQKTPIRFPEYSFAAIPFNWMSKKDSEERIKLLELDFDATREPNLDFGTSNWIQEYKNQKAMLNGFFEHLDPLKSLVFIYAKQVPFVEEGGRVLIGVGRITNIIESEKYDADYTGDLECAYWEHMVSHTIRPGFDNGFILPYHEAIKYQETHSDFDIAQLAVIAPSDTRFEFSFASEHVSHNTAIRVLLQCVQKLELAKSFGIGEHHDKSIKWIHDRLSEIEKLRGDYPGMGAALCAFGLEKGHFVAAEIINNMPEGSNPWELFAKALDEPKGILSPEVATLLHLTVKRHYQRLIAKPSSERLNLLHLLSRFDLTIEQATLLFVTEKREELQVKATDAEILNNPYLIYELTRLTANPVELTVIDFGLMATCKKPHLLPIGFGVSDPLDDRRVRAFTIQELEKAVLQGNTLLPRKALVNILRELPLPDKILIDGDKYELAEEAFVGAITNVEMKDGSPAYQLSRMAEISNIIRDRITKRKQADRLVIKEDWKKLLDEELDKYTQGKPDKNEPKAREEKVAALVEMAESRISVLIGPAGTGKTTLLTILARQADIEKGGIVFLAPTGKARVRMQEIANKNNLNIPSFTLAQFLIDLKRYDPNTQRYVLSGVKSSHKYETVILDEASMLTEEMLATLLDSFESVKRFILVGDSRQLPPIGAGRPFIDIIKFLEPENIDMCFPKVGSGYTELTIRRRQGGANRSDIQLAEWFSGNPLAAGEDSIINELIHKKDTKHVRLVQWENESDFESKLEQVIVEELKLADIKDKKTFNISLGSTEDQYFNYKVASLKIEDWQVLSPVREKPYGVKNINRVFHNWFRKSTVDYCNSFKNDTFPSPNGIEQIVYGDKIINLSNQRRGDRYKPVWPDGGINYIANGEIGVVIGQVKTKKMTFLKGRPKNMEVEFASQTGYKYTFNSSEFGEEGNTNMELAYCITVHKSQGSEFNTVFLVIPNPCFLLSREMLYTALTRQKDRVVVLHQGDFSSIKELTSPRFSDAIKRITNLFEAPQMVESKRFPGIFLEKHLIQEASDGTLLRSKSELGIYELMLKHKLNAIYEKPLDINDVIKYPDFTIDDDDAGKTYYWEHCGMMHDYEYVERWEDKLKWYRSNNILPFEEGGGKNGTLIVSYDKQVNIDGSSRGAISLKEIEVLILKVFKK